MSRLNVVAKIVARKESVEDLKNELLKLVTPTRREEGCLEYRLHQDISNPAVFFFYETWESEECLVRHTQTEHYKQYVSAIGGLTEERVVSRLLQIA